MENFLAAAAVVGIINIVRVNLGRGRREWLLFIIRLEKLLATNR